jgi:hypothetical protein
LTTTAMTTTTEIVISVEVTKVRMAATRKRMWKRMAAKTSPISKRTGDEAKREAEYREKSGGLAKMPVIGLRRCYWEGLEEEALSNLYFVNFSITKAQLKT